MENEELIRVELICSSYNIESAFIDSLFDFGLIEIMELEENRYVEKKRINDLEKMIHLHYDLNINLEGIDTITHLLNKMYELQEELNQMKNRLQLYENH